MAVEKRRVTMTNQVLAGRDSDGQLRYHTHEAVDFVPTDILDAYVADARKRWRLVEVGDSHDPGPGGDDGETHYPTHLTGA